MIYSFLLLFLYCLFSEGSHFSGGTIRWQPINPSNNSTSVPITITQSYSWTALAITCDNNIPITTFNRSNQNTNLTCMADCSTDGGYSLRPVNILTDCQAVSASLNLVSSQRSVNINLTANASFYLVHIGSPWIPIGNPSQSGLQWSMVTYINLRLRSDGFINTPPVASVVSPLYAIVNQATQITIPVFDVNAGDTVRCRWSQYIPGYRRRKRYDSNDENKEFVNRNDGSSIYEKPLGVKETILRREKRARCSGTCGSTCDKGCRCSCTSCRGTTCSGKSCTTNAGCQRVSTTVDTPGTTKLTTSYPNRQAIDECGGICYPGSMPSGTTLSGCTISFTGLVADTWYAVALQVNTPNTYRAYRYLFSFLERIIFCLLNRSRILLTATVPFQ